MVAGWPLQLWDQLDLDAFWSERLAVSRQGTRWLNVLKTLVAYRLLDPGSEWRLHRQWFDARAMGDLLGEDLGLVQADKLYRCLDKLLVHKADFFTVLKARWQTLFGPSSTVSEGFRPLHPRKLLKMGLTGNSGETGSLETPCTATKYLISHNFRAGFEPEVRVATVRGPSRRHGF